MDAYVQQDTAGFAFEKPFQPQGSGPLRPFSAVDLAPPAKPGTPGPLVAPVSPFLASYDGPTTSNAGNAAAAAALLAESEMPPAPAPLPPSPPPPAAARQSRILAASDLLGSIEPAVKPDFFLTSTPTVDGYRIQAYLDFLSVEIVLPKDLLFRNPAPYGELHRLKAAEDELQKVKATAIEELTDKAKTIDADGIVGVTVTFTNLDTVCCLCSAMGTAVRIG